MTDQNREIIITESGMRADKAISAALPELSRSAVQNLIAGGHVFWDGKPVAKSAKLPLGSVLVVEIPPARPLDVRPENIPLDFLNFGFLYCFSSFLRGCAYCLGRNIHLFEKCEHFQFRQYFRKLNLIRLLEAVML